MTTKVRRSVRVSVPVTTAYNQWTQFEEFPRFMGAVTSVTQLADDRLRWVAEIAGVKRQWEARIVEQVPDEKIAWAATEGATNAGAVLFQDIGGGQTSVTLELEYEPEGLVEKAGSLLGLVEKQAESDLERFKAFIESEEGATGAWRGSIDAGAGVGSPGVEDAAASRGDSGEAGISGKAAAAGAAAVAAGAAAVAVARRSGDEKVRTVEETEAGTSARATAPPAVPGAGTTSVAPSAGVDPAGTAEARVESGPARLVGIDDPATGTHVRETIDPATGAPLQDTTAELGDTTEHPETTNDPRSTAEELRDTTREDRV